MTVGDLVGAPLPPLLSSGGPSVTTVPPESADQCWRGPDGGVCAWGWTDGPWHHLEVAGAGVFSFGGGGREVFVVADPHVGTDRITDVYERSVLPMALQSYGLEAIHSAGYLTGAGVVALCGVSGSGKSTLTAGMVERGYAAWADDAVVWEAQRAGVVSRRLPFRVRLMPDAEQKLRPSPMEDALAGDSPEVEVLGAVIELQPKRDDPAWGLERLSPSEATKVVLTHSYAFDLGDTRRRATMENVLDLVSSLPVFRLTFPRRFSALPTVLDRLVEAAHSLRCRMGWPVEQVV